MHTKTSMKSTPSGGRGPRTLATPSRRVSRPDDGNAFLPDNLGKLQPLPANDAESLAEEFVASATACESVREDANDEVVDDEEGGPFLVLDDDAQLPPEREERDPEREGHGPVQREQIERGAWWSSRGI